MVRFLIHALVQAKEVPLNVRLHPKVFKDLVAREKKAKDPSRLKCHEKGKTIGYFSIFLSFCRVRTVKRDSKG